MDFNILKKAGALRNGAERGQGTVWHIVEAKNSYCGVALCGQYPAIQWTDGADTANCPRCIKRHAAICADAERTANEETRAVHIFDHAK